jgi:hypothetical protein
MSKQKRAPLRAATSSYVMAPNELVCGRCGASIDHHSLLSSSSSTPLRRSLHCDVVQYSVPPFIMTSTWQDSNIDERLWLSCASNDKRDPPSQIARLIKAGANPSFEYRKLVNQTRTCSTTTSPPAPPWFLPSRDV